MTIIDDLTLADAYPVWKVRIAAAERPVLVDLGTISPDDPHPGVQMLKMWEGVEVRHTPAKKTKVVATALTKDTTDATDE